MLGERPLRLRCSEQRLARIGEGEVEGVALHLHLHSTLAGERLPEQAAVMFERSYVCLFAEPLQQPRRALNVGEEQRDSAARSSAMAQLALKPRALQRESLEPLRCHGGDASPVAPTNDSPFTASYALAQRREER